MSDEFEETTPLGRKVSPKNDAPARPLPPVSFFSAEGQRRRLEFKDRPPVRAMRPDEEAAFMESLNRRKAAAESSTKDGARRSRRPARQGPEAEAEPAPRSSGRSSPLHGDDQSGADGRRRQLGRALGKPDDQADDQRVPESVEPGSPAEVRRGTVLPERISRRGVIGGAPAGGAV